MTIPVNIPAVPKNAKKYVASVIDKNWISSLCLDEEVNFLKKLEDGFSSFVKTKYGIAVTSGTTALDLALATLGIGPDDEVIVPSFTMIATASCVIHNGAKPVFVDADPNTWCMDTSLIERVITEKTKAIIPTHIYGYPVEMDSVLEIAKKYNLVVIEDSAEAIGTLYKGRMAGGIADIGCFSFYGNKTITCGEGGMLVTNNESFAKRAAKLKDQAYGEPRFIHDEIGFNFRMNNLTAAYAYASFEEVDDYITKKQNNAKLYNELLKETEGITLPPESTLDCINSYWMYGILIDEKKFGISKIELREILKSKYKIDTRDFFYPMHKQPIMIKKGYSNNECIMPVSEKLWQDGLYLPSSVNLYGDKIEFICNAIKEIGRKI